MNVNNGEKAKRSLDLLARQLRNENGETLVSVHYERGQQTVHIAGGKAVRPWVADRIERIAVKYSMPVIDWNNPETFKKEEEDKPAKAPRVTVRQLWAQLNGVLDMHVDAVKVAKAKDSNRANVMFVVDGQIVQPFDMHIQSYKYAKKNRETKSNARQVAKLALELVELIVKAVAKREKMRLAPNKLEIEGWDNKGTLVLRFKELGKEHLNLPTKKQEEKAAAPRKHRERANAVHVSADDL